MAAPPLLSISRALPTKLLLIPSILRLLNDFLLPTTLDAAVANDLQRVTRLYGDSRPWSVDAMNVAATSGRLDLFDRLSPSHKKAVIVQAATFGHLNVVEHLAEKHKGYLHLEALKAAAANGHGKVVEHLLPSSSEYWPFVVVALKEAALNGHVELTSRLLKNRATMRNLTNVAQKVVEQGHVDVVQLLVRSGRAETPFVLITAAKAGSSKLVKFLVPLCDLESVTMAIGAAAMYGHVKLVKFLLKRGDVEKIGPAFVKAASRNQVKTLKLLLDAWATKPSKDPVKRTAISAAVKEAVLLGHLNSVRLLTDTCDPMLVGPALRLAVVKNNVEIAKVLARVSTQPAIAHQAATAASRRLSSMTRVLLKYCEPAVLETALEDMVAFDNFDTAKFLVEKTSDQATDTVLEIAIERDSANLVMFLQGLRNSTVSKL